MKYFWKFVLPPAVSYLVVLLIGFLFHSAPSAFTWVPWITETGDRFAATAGWFILSLIGWGLSFGWEALNAEAESSTFSLGSIRGGGDDGGYCDGCGDREAQSVIKAKRNCVFCKKCVKKMSELLPS